MAIPIEDFRQPTWIKYKERYPLSYDKKDRFYKFNTNPRSYRNGGFKQAGYNVSHNSTRIENVNLESDNITLKPY